MTKHEDKIKIINERGPRGALLCTMYFGAAVYFVQQSDGFFGFFWALIKALVWPAILVYNGLEAFGV